MNTNDGKKIGSGWNFKQFSSFFFILKENNHFHKVWLRRSYTYSIIIPNYTVYIHTYNLYSENSYFYLRGKWVSIIIQHQKQ